MPGPNEIRRDPNTGEMRMWTGSQWMSFTNPNKDIPSQRTDADDHELLKQFLTIGGATAGGILGGPAGSIAGGGLGRTLAHIPEALTTAATGQPNTGSFLTDPAIGAMEGATQEILPKVLGPMMKYGGKGMKWVGEHMPAPSWKHAASGEMLGEFFGLPRGAGGAGGLVLDSGPAMTKVGGAAERGGTSLGAKTTSQHLRDAVDGIGAPKVEPRMPNQSGYSGRAATAAEDAPLPTSSMADVDPYQPSSSGYSAAEPPMKADPLPQQQYDYRDPVGTPGGPPAPVVEPPTPSRLDQALADYQKQIGDSPISPRARESLVREFGEPTAAVDVTSQVDDAVGGLSSDAPIADDLPVPDTGTGPKLDPRFKTLPRGDDYWGPGSRTRSGDIAMGNDANNNPLYDPQTPSDYLRQQLRDATDPAERDFLFRSLDQRYRIHRATSGMSGR